MYWQNASDVLVFGFVPLVWLTGLIVGRFRLVLVVKTAVFALAYLHVGVYFICVLLQKSSESLFSFYGALLLFLAPLVWLIAVILNIAEFVTIYHLRKKSPSRIPMKIPHNAGIFGNNEKEILQERGILCTILP